MRVLYGVCGEGMGHATRSAVVGAHLERRGHQVTYASGPGRALDHLQARSARPVLRVLGPAWSMRGNQIDPAFTALSNVFRIGAGTIANLPALLQAERLRVDVVISDFDYWSSWASHRLGAPLLAVDSVHFLTRCSHDPSLMREEDRRAAAITLPLARMVVPGARRYLVTSFADAPIVGESTTLHRPILREEILMRGGWRATPAKASRHVVAYFFDGADHRRMALALGAMGMPVRIYGKAGLRAEEQWGNVTFCPTSAEGFARDLASCTAVVGSTYTLMSEAIYLGKPMLAVPFGGQYEMALNASYLERLGYGMRAPAGELTGETVADFAGRLGEFEEALRSREGHDANRELLASVEGAMRDVTGLAA